MRNVQSENEGERPVFSPVCSVHVVPAVLAFEKHYLLYLLSKRTETDVWKICFFFSQILMVFGPKLESQNEVCDQFLTQFSTF